MNTPHGYAQIIRVFGNPVKSDGTVDEVWRRENITNVRPPIGWQLYYQQNEKIVAISSIQLHKSLSSVFSKVLSEIWIYAASQTNSGDNTDDTRKWLRERNLDVIGGSYNPRYKRQNSNELSLHTWGIAIDWDPIHNPMKKPLTTTLPEWWYQIWSTNGWHDGRRFPTPDPMHVQFATGA